MTIASVAQLPDRATGRHDGGRAIVRGVSSIGHVVAAGAAADAGPPVAAPNSGLTAACWSRRPIARPAHSLCAFPPDHRRPSTVRPKLPRANSTPMPIRKRNSQQSDQGLPRASTPATHLPPTPKELAKDLRNGHLGAILRKAFPTQGDVRLSNRLTPGYPHTKSLSQNGAVASLLTEPLGPDRRSPRVVLG